MQLLLVSFCCKLSHIYPFQLLEPATDTKLVKRRVGYDRYLDSKVRLPSRLGVLGLPDLLRSLRLSLVLLFTDHDI